MIGSAFKDAIVGGKSFEQVLKTLALRLASLAFERALAPVTSAIVGCETTLFPLARGLGLMGEAGAEAVLPLAEAATASSAFGAVPPRRSTSRRPWRVRTRRTAWAQLKGWRTMIVSLALAVVGVLQTADWARIVPADQVGPVMLTVAIVVAVLRTLTDTPVGRQ